MESKDRQDRAHQMFIPVLSICAHCGYLASAGDDGRVALWHLEDNWIVKVICDHEDGMLCIRFDDMRLGSCSKCMSSTFCYVSNLRHPSIGRSDSKNIFVS